MTDHIPLTLYEFAFSKCTKDLFVNVLSESEWIRDMPEFNDILCVSKENSVNTQFICAMERSVSNDLLQFLLNFHADMDHKVEHQVAKKACSLGNVSVLQFAHNHGCDWDEEICCRAAANGHLDCLKYAHEQGCPWDSTTCTCALENGHLDCLKYATEHGCSFVKIYRRHTNFALESI